MKRNPIVIVLPDIRSAMNIGAIFRTADAILAEKIYLTGYSATPEHSKVAKTAIGAENEVPWEYIKSTAEVINILKGKGYQIIGLEKTTKSRVIWDIGLEHKVALVVGNEINGICEEILELCDNIAELPMLGTKESLNVATATGIALYEIIRVLKLY